MTETLPRAGAGSEELPENPWPGAIAIMLATLMVYLDTTVVNLSLPYMAGSLSSTVEDATWSLTSYLAANAVVLPMAGWLATLVGRRRLILFGLTGFIAASLACGLAINLPMLIVFRVVQGLTGGLLQPLSQAVMLESFPVEKRGQAMGLWSTGIVLAPVLGPMVGGYLTEHASWRWVFFINVPIGLLGLLLVHRHIRDPSYIRPSTHIDWRGIGLLALGIGALQIALDRGQEKDWLDSGMIVALLVIAVVAMLWFVVHALRARDPVADLRVFRDLTFAAGSFLSAGVGFLLFGSIVVLPLLLQLQLGYPPLKAGLAIVPRGLGALISFPIVGLLTDRYDSRKLLTAGLLLGAVTMYWFSTLAPTLGYWDLVAPQFIQGIALGLLFVPLSTTTMHSIPLAQMGNASSLYNVMRNLGSSIGIALSATHLERSFLRHRQQLAAHVDPFDPLTQERLELLRSAALRGGADPTSAHQQALAGLDRMVVEQAGMLSYLDTFRLFAWIFLAMLPFVLFMKKRDAPE